MTTNAPAGQAMIASPMNWIDGAPQQGNGPEFVLTNPVDGSVLTTYRGAGRDQVDHAVASARAAFEAWRDHDPFSRSDILQRVAGVIRDHAEELAHLETTNAGKPIRDTRVEVAKCAEMFGYYAGLSTRLHGDVVQVPGPWTTFAEREAIGVIGIFTPWNAPLFTASWNSAAAIACGNTVVLKPSEFTPLTTVRLAELANSVGLPAGVLNVVVGEGSVTGSALVDRGDIDKLSFIGSVGVGRQVASTAASHGVPSLLELGGKSAFIVFADADLRAAARGAVNAIFSNAGQSCTAGSRLLVHRSVAAEVTELVCEMAGRLRVGDPLDASTEIGPIANRRQLDRICELVDAGIAQGARRGTDSAVPANLPAGGNWLAPTVLVDAGPSNPVVTQEIFGPVLTVVAFDDENEAVAVANDSGFGLAGAVWTGSIERAHRVAHRLRAGTIWINAYKAIHVAAPFGGFGISGWGRSSGPDVVYEYTAPRVIWVPREPYRGNFESIW